jgi:hypothetical protein
MLMEAGAGGGGCYLEDAGMVGGPTFLSPSAFFLNRAPVRRPGAPRPACSGAPRHRGTNFLLARQS